MKGAITVIIILIMACAVAWSYLTPIYQGVDLRHPTYDAKGLWSEQEWTTYTIGSRFDLEDISREKQERIEEERRRRNLASQLERERGTDVERIYQDWNGAMG